MSKSLRNLFFSKLTNKTYYYLKNNYLRNLETAQIYQFVNEIINENMDSINNYLISYQVTLSNLDAAVDMVMASLIVPYIENMKVV